MTKSDNEKFWSRVIHTLTKTLQILIIHLINCLLQYSLPNTYIRIDECEGNLN